MIERVDLFNWQIYLAQRSSHKSRAFSTADYSQRNQFGEGCD